MSNSQHFIDRDPTTPIMAGWLNDVNLAIYELLGNAGNPPLTRADILTNLGIGTGGVSSASNIGTGVGVYKQQVGADLRFLSLLAGANVTLTETANGIVIASTGGGGGAATGLVREYTTATAGQTLVNVTTAYAAGDSGTLTVYLDGLLLRRVIDYTETSVNSITMTTALAAGQLVITVVGGGQGLQGATGPAGADGAAATVAVGTTTTLPAGSAATVTNVGTPSAAVFNFGIPKGADGTGAGDMLKSVYDTNNNGKVDVSERVDLNLTAGLTATQGQLVWNADESTADLGLNSACTLQVGQEMLVYVRNSTASTIPNGSAVMFTGTIGASGRITVAPMVATSANPGYVFVGIATQDIAAGADGFATVFGKVRGLNTSAWAAGTILWCDPAVAGGLTSTQPSAPNLKLPVAAVVTSHATVGTLLVRGTAGARLKDLHDVEAASPTGNQLLAWNASTSRWEPTGLVTVTALRETSATIAASDIDLATANYFSRTIGGATTFTVSNVPASGTVASFILNLTNGGSATVTWWAGVKWAGGSAPTLTAAGRDVLGFFTPDGGTTWTGLVLGKDVK